MGLPQMIQREILPYGSDTTFVRESLLTAKALFDTHHLGTQFDKARALSSALKAVRDFAAMAELKHSLENDQNAAIAKLEGAVKGNQLRLPTIPNLTSRVGSYLAHARAVYLSLLAIVELFYPKKKSKDSWRATLESGLADYLSKNESARDVVAFAVQVMEFVNNARNAYEHPDTTKGVEVSDFAVVPGGLYRKPRVKIVSGSEVLADADVDYLTNKILENLAGAFESVCVVMCDANIKPFGPVETRVGQQPEEMARKGSKFVYQSWLREGVVLPTAPMPKQS
jgi:hypothetical protein